MAQVPVAEVYFVQGRSPCTDPRPKSPTGGTAAPLPDRCNSPVSPKYYTGHRDLRTGSGSEADGEGPHQGSRSLTLSVPEENQGRTDPRGHQEREVPVGLTSLYLPSSESTTLSVGRPHPELRTGPD